MNDNKHIHFIGICGVAMSALALAFHKKGYRVTGSDKGIYPPISTYLKNAGVEYYTGWHPEKMGAPDLVVVGNVAGSTNPEWMYVKENDIPYKSYPEVVGEFFVADNSIVCAGTYGKTTSSSILTWVLKDNGFDPSYMFGGISLNNIPAAELSDSKHSILEGDEYKSARWDNGPKFAHYSPTHLLLTSVVWDHADVYPTEESYVDAFANLLKNIPETGLVVLSAKVTHERPELVDLVKSKVITYGKTDDNDYQYSDVKTSKEGVSFNIYNNSNTYNIQTESLGDYMADNITGCFAMAHQLGIAPGKIIKSLKTFKNIKRRLEKRYSNGITVFDDIAHSPKKAEAVLASLKNIYDGKITAIFEPNGGNRLQKSIPGYDNKFISADVVIIPRLTRIKQDSTKPKNLDGQDLTDVISKTHDNVKYIDDDEKLISHLVDNTNAGDVVIFLGSHGFRGMIDELISSFRTK
jgi:UDP-N-acetylmuramate: L-alanyl-gamma-D-glutamyl-meso-diaminopimelate ligase